MTPRPTGRVRPTTAGADLVLTRTFRASIEDVWHSVTDPDSTARWIGRWERVPDREHDIRLQMSFEADAPWSPGVIERCEPPRHLAITAGGDMQLELTLAAHGDTTELTFVHRLADPAMAGDYGPGWEYYLDMLVAARDGTARPEFTDYDPSQRAYFLGAAKQS